MCASALRGQREGVRSPGTEVTGGCEPFDMSAGNQTTKPSL